MLLLTFSRILDRAHAEFVRDDDRDDRDGHHDEINFPADLNAVALRLCWTPVKLRPFDHQTLPLSLIHVSYGVSPQDRSMW